MSCPTSERADCCCGCVGCHKWVSDNGGGFVATVSYTNCGSEQWTGLQLEGGGGPGGEECTHSFAINWPQGNTFIDGNLFLDWNPSTEKFDWELITDFPLADCGLDTAHAEEIEYECTPCHCKLVLSVPVNNDLGGCPCAGPVIFTIELDLSDGPECEQ